MRGGDVPWHAGETVTGADSDQDSLHTELDEEKPGCVLVTMTEEDEFAGGLYLTAEDARAFGRALIFMADNANYFLENPDE